ncbi:MAG: PDZ domain-containing protein [Phycisphaerae bacterium]|nr:PDZ domain-containing protein [Phycisphaerae bacterium]
MSKRLAAGSLRRNRCAMYLLAVLSLLATGQVRAQANPEMSPDDLKKAEDLREDLRRMIELARDQVFPALVNIRVSTVDYWGGKKHKGAATGSGTIISTEGYVLTNQHVTDTGKKFKCTLADKQEVTATMVGEDPLTDLAVIKLDLSELKSPSTPLPVARFGNSDELAVGDYVMAMGSPFSLSRSVTLGIVSNNTRVFTGRGSGEEVEEMELDSGQRTGLFTRWIQHDALIHPGNSGGPLVNLKGEIIGVNELGGSGMGFAIPSNLARQVADSLIKYGEVPRSWIGVSFKPIAKTGYDRGVLVNSVFESGPAAKAGIEPGDVILRIDGEALTIRFAEEVPPLLKRLADVPIGSQMKVSFLRKDEVHEVTLTTEKLLKDRGQQTSLRSFGITVSEITPRMALSLRRPNTKGVMVNGTRSGGPADLAEPSLRFGDVVIRVENDEIDNLEGMVKAYEKIMKMESTPEYVLIEFDRGGKNHLTVIKPKPEEPDDPPRDIRKAWIGIATQPIIEKLAKKLGHPDQPGFRVTRVYPLTKAAESDLRVGDIIVALNGEKLKIKGMQDAGLLARLIKRLDPDGKVTLKVVRGDETLDVEVKLEPTKYGPSEALRLTNKDFEITIRNITFFDRDENQWDKDVQGVIVEQVESGGWASMGGVQPNDLIQQINEYPVKSRTSFRRAMEAIAKEQPERVVFLVLRGVQTRFQFVEPEWKPAIDVKDAADSGSAVGEAGGSSANDNESE